MVRLLQFALLVTVLFQSLVALPGRSQGGSEPAMYFDARGSLCVRGKPGTRAQVYNDFDHLNQSFDQCMRVYFGPNTKNGIRWDPRILVHEKSLLESRFFYPFQEGELPHQYIPRIRNLYSQAYQALVRQQPGGVAPESQAAKQVARARQRLEPVPQGPVVSLNSLQTTMPYQNQGLNQRNNYQGREPVSTRQPMTGVAGSNVAPNGSKMQYPRIYQMGNLPSGQRSQSIPGSRETDYTDYRGSRTYKTSLPQNASPATLSQLMGTNRALLIGTDTYQNQFPRLSNAIYDVEAMERVLREQYGWQTKVLKNPRLKEIKTELGLLTGQTTYQTNDQLLIYFAGHGYYDKQMAAGYVVTEVAPEFQASN